MSDVQRIDEQRERAGRVFEVVIRLGAIFLLLFWGLLIVAPFLHPIVWGVIVAVALYPAFVRLASLLGGRAKLAGAIFIVAAILLVIVPAGMLAASSMDGITGLAQSWQAGDLKVPPPPDAVRDLPLIGEELHASWLEASQNLELTAKRFAPQLQKLGGLLLSAAWSSGAVLVLLTFSLVIAGVLMIQGEACVSFARALATRLIGDEGEEFLRLSTSTIRGVAMGVIGTALIQAAAAALGFVVMGIPIAALWASLVLVLAIVQLPTLLVLLPVVVWAFTAYGTAPASVFAVWCALVGFGDNVLKPLLMGRGQEVPMLVLLVGSLGGMILSGIMGLFVGAVVLAVIYRLFNAWLAAPGGEAASTPAA